MTPAQKAAVIEAANKRRGAISEEKGREYSGKNDVLRNFKQQGERLGLTSIEVLGVYFGKHIDSIETFMREFPLRETYAAQVSLVAKGEGLLSRLDDARNYLDLLECLLMELELHPDKMNDALLAQHELTELVEALDWSKPGFQMKDTEAADGFDLPPLMPDTYQPTTYRLLGGADGAVKEGRTFSWKRK